MKILRLILIAIVVLALADWLLPKLISHRQVIRSIYAWSGSVDLARYVGSPERDFTLKHDIKKVYVKMIDVGWSPELGIIPNSISDIYRYSDTSYVFVPVAFIENRVFSNIDSTGIDLLCINVMRHLMRFETHNTKIYEYQIDCDWSASTQKNYFQFLRRMRILRPQYIQSVTIRLYQAKYPEKTGIPPADRGMLMVYNMGDATKLVPENSIYNDDLAEEYIPDKAYPLPLDIALPAFSWGLFYRGEKLLGVKSNVSEAMCDSLPFLKRAEDAPIYKVVKDTVWDGSLLRYGDFVKPENCYNRELKSAAKIAEKFCNSDTVNIALFDLDTFDLNNIRYESIEQAYNTFR